MVLGGTSANAACGRDLCHLLSEKPPSWNTSAPTRRSAHVRPARADHRQRCSERSGVRLSTTERLPASFGSAVDPAVEDGRTAWLSTRYSDGVLAVGGRVVLMLRGGRVVLRGRRSTRFLSGGEALRAPAGWPHDVPEGVGGCVGEDAFDLGSALVEVRPTFVVDGEGRGGCTSRPSSRASCALMV